MKSKGFQRKNTLTIKKCKECKEDFESPTYKMRAFCSHTCANKVEARKKMNKAKRDVVCKTCKKTFTKRASDLKMYASYAGKKRGQYCSRECFTARIQNISSLKKRAWVVFSRYIRERDNWTCFTCGIVKAHSSLHSGMHAGHFISRSHNSTLYDEKNVHAQCASCNMYRNGQPHIYADKIIRIYGKKAFDDLIKRGRLIKKFTKPELLELHDYYKAKLNQKLLCQWEKQV
jgi:hypothetical protein